MLYEVITIFVGSDPADRGFVHFDVFGDIAQDQRFQILRSTFKKVALEPEDRLHNLVDGALPLIERFDEPFGALHLFGDVAAFV